MSTLAGKTVAILVANGFEEVHMTEPQRALGAVGAAPKIVSQEQGLVNGWHEEAWGHFFPVDVSLSEALAADFDALLIPSGFRGVERLDGNPHARRIVKGFMDAAKPVAVFGHGLRLLASAERLAGRTVAAEGDVAEAAKAAGAVLSEEATTVDGNLLTLRDDADVTAAREAIAEHFSTVAARIADAA